MEFWKRYKWKTGYVPALFLAVLTGISAAAGSIHADEYIGPEKTAETTAPKPVREWMTVSMWKAKLSDYKGASLKKYKLPKDVKKVSPRLYFNGIGSGYYQPVLGYEDPDYDVFGADTSGSDVSEKVSGSFEFTVGSDGEGIGMALDGADYMARYGGCGYEDILAAFYPETYIMTEDCPDKELSVSNMSGSAADVVSAVVYKNMISGMDTEAVKALAVAAYSYIRCGGGAELEAAEGAPIEVQAAVDEVLGQYVCFGGGTAFTKFFRSGSGTTADYSDFYEGSLPYLKGVSYSGGDKGSTVTVTASEAKSILEDALGVSLSGSPEQWIELKKGSGGYVVSAEVGSETVSGAELAELMGLGGTKFDVRYSK